MVKEKKSDVFNVSKGNMGVLMLFPEMMSISKYRTAFRMLTIEYLMEKQGGMKYGKTKGFKK